MISASQARQLCETIQKDAECWKRIHDPKYWQHGRWAGWNRNAAIDPEGSKYDWGNPKNPYIRFLCVGISIQVANAINGVRGKIGWLNYVESQSTNMGEHTAVLVHCKDGSDGVIDFWQTLCIQNPVIIDLGKFQWSMYMVAGVELCHYS